VSHTDELKQAYLDKKRAEVQALEQAGVVMQGSAFAEILFLKADFNAEENKDLANNFFTGQDGAGLKATCDRLGYAPEAWAALACADAQLTPLSPDLLRQAILTVSPETVVACDESAAHLLREAYVDELVSIEDFDTATLAAGHIAYLQGMRVMNLGGFEASLGSQEGKRTMWAYLKQLTPLRDPY
jgi:hypothetical protein